MCIMANVTKYPNRGPEGAPTIKGNQLKAGQTGIVRGEITFGRLVTPYEGEALKRYNADRFARNSSAIALEGPLFVVNLKNAELVPTPKSKPDGTSGNEQFETFLSESLYTSDNKPEYGVQFSKEWRSGFPPQVFVKGEDGAFTQLEKGLTGDLATGVKVILVLGTFEGQSPKRGHIAGSSVRQVFIDETGPVRYFAGSLDRDLLAGAGLRIEGPVVLAQPTAPTAAGDAELAAEAPAAPQPDSDALAGLL